MSALSCACLFACLHVCKIPEIINVHNILRHAFVECIYNFYRIDELMHAGFPIDIVVFLWST